MNDQTSDNPINRESIGSILSIDISNRNSINATTMQDNSSSEKLSTLNHIYLLLTLKDKNFDIKTYKLFIKFSILLMTINVIVYIGINAGVVAIAQNDNL